MRALYAALAALSLVALAGCPGSTTSTTGKVGGPGATPGADRGGGLLGPGENQFTLDMPNLETTIKQGEAKVVEIGINRGKNFEQDVTLIFQDPPAGVTIDPPQAKIAKGEKGAKVTVKAAENAALGHHEIKATGKGGGPDVVGTLKIEVAKQ